MTNQTIQAYRQAPWRVQYQWIGLFMLGLTLVASVASVYLNVSASAAAAGREIQDIEEQSTALQRSIADLETDLAYLTSASTIQERAEDLGYQGTGQDNALYMVVPGYTGRQPAIMAPPPGPGMVISPILKPAYTQSLWEWLFEGFLSTQLSQQVVRP